MLRPATDFDFSLQEWELLKVVKQVVITFFHAHIFAHRFGLIATP